MQGIILVVIYHSISVLKSLNQRFLSLRACPPPSLLIGADLSIGDRSLVTCNSKAEALRLAYRRQCSMFVEQYNISGPAFLLL